MNKSGIEWTEYTANPIRGKCPHLGTKRCKVARYAERLRLKQGWDAKLSFHPKVLSEIEKRKKPATIFMGSMIDIFAKGLPVEDWLDKVLDTMYNSPQHTFLCLTKNPSHMAEIMIGTSGTGAPLIDEYFPNVFWGATVNNDEMYTRKEWEVFSYLPNTFLSLEPLLGPVDIKGLVREFFPNGLRQIIIGAQTNPTIIPEQNWVHQIMNDAWLRKIPVFIKDNLRQHYSDLPQNDKLAWRVK